MRIKKNKTSGGVTSAALHIIAMISMLIDHIGVALVPCDTLRIIGRLAFPIFAFMIAEGFKHTKNLKKYMLRLFLFAIISEVPCDLMGYGVMVYMGHQNVMWTFLLALAGLWMFEKAIRVNDISLRILCGAGVILFFTILAFFTRVDYGGYGILTVFTFYLFDKRKEYPIIKQVITKWSEKKRMILWNVICFIGQSVVLAYLYLGMMQRHQGYALFALIPIWLYNGQKGYSAKWIKYMNYAFYPLHYMILAIITMV